MHSELNYLSFSTHVVQGPPLITCPDCIIKQWTSTIYMLQGLSRGTKLLINIKIGTPYYETSVVIKFIEWWVGYDISVYSNHKNHWRQKM